VHKRKSLEIPKREMPSYIKRQVHQNKSGLLKGNLKVRKMWNDVPQVLKENNC
jgi:hypothetical protein